MHGPLEPDWARIIAFEDKHDKSKVYLPTKAWEKQKENDSPSFFVDGRVGAAASITYIRKAIDPRNRLPYWPLIRSVIWSMNATGPLVHLRFTTTACIYSQGSFQNNHVVFLYPAITMTKKASYIIVSGGTACNHIARTFHDSAINDICYVLSISDNGGSSSELLRVLGGPSIGDLRSRLTRLIDFADPQPSSPERMAMKDLLSYRLPADATEQEVMEEWLCIVEGRHSLWNAIPNEKKEAIRGFLTSFHCEALKRAHKRFDFRNGSIGNFFLTGARLFLGSLEAALFLFSAITGISERTTVLPVINTNHTATIAARLANGQILAGQNEISHPPPSSTSEKRGRHCIPGCRWTHANPIDAFSHLALSNEDSGDPSSPVVSTNLFFCKEDNTKLAARIERIYYINQYGQEIYPLPNPKFITQLSSAKETLVYSIGSLYTSIVPCLILRHVGNTIAHSCSLRKKILLLNGSNDRETSDYDAMDFIQTITAALNQSRNIDARHAFYETCDTSSGLATPPFPEYEFNPYSPSSFITHLIYLDNSAIPVDVKAIESLGIKCVSINGKLSESGLPIYDELALTEAIQSCS